MSDEFQKIIIVARVIPYNCVIFHSFSLLPSLVVSEPKFARRGLIVWEAEGTRIWC